MSEAGKGVLLGRRGFLAAGAALGVLALPGCATVERSSYVEVVRRLLLQASRRAFARLTAPDGFWNSTVARIELPVLFGKRGGVLEGILTSDAFRQQLQHRLNNFAEDGARRAAPIVAEVVREIGIENAEALVRGDPTGATSYLRQAMGTRLVNEMAPALEDALRIANDPLVGQAIALLAGVDLRAVAQSVALGADNALWYAIGEEEAAIRADPRSTDDSVLIGTFRAG